MKYSNKAMKSIIELSLGGEKSGEDAASITQMSCTSGYCTSSALVSSSPSSPANDTKDEIIVESPGGTIYLDGLFLENSKGNPNMPVLDELITPPSVEKELVRKPDTLVDLDIFEPDREKVKTSPVSYGKRLIFVVEELEKEVNFHIRVNFLTKKGVIKHIDGLGKVTFERIQNILKNGLKEKMWGCTYFPPNRNRQAIVVHVEWIEKNDRKQIIL